MGRGASTTVGPRYRGKLIIPLQTRIDEVAPLAEATPLEDRAYGLIGKIADSDLPTAQPTPQ
jgi:hypothetical protein